MNEPIIVIAAGRSGSNMMRDAIANHPEVVTWPCDEINYIWRYGNAHFSTDELHPEHATPGVKSYIRAKFERISKQQGGSRVLEKTSANSLRVEYVHEIFPEARYIFLIRDGRDVSASACQRWRASIDWGYILKKAKWVPTRDIPYYGFRYLSNRVFRLSNGQKRVKSWGPRFTGMQEAVQNHSLIEACGIQWAKCVANARKGLQRVPSSQKIEIRYEELVAEPIGVFRTIFEFLGMTYEDCCIEKIRDFVTPANVGKWKTELSSHDLRKLIPHIRNCLTREGYIK